MCIRDRDEALDALEALEEDRISAQERLEPRAAALVEELTLECTSDLASAAASLQRTIEQDNQEVRQVTAEANSLQQTRGERHRVCEEDLEQRVRMLEGALLAAEADRSESHKSLQSMFQEQLCLRLDESLQANGVQAALNEVKFRPSFREQLLDKLRVLSMGLSEEEKARRENFAQISQERFAETLSNLREFISSERASVTRFNGSLLTKIDEVRAELRSALDQEHAERLHSRDQLDKCLDFKVRAVELLSRQRAIREVEDRCAALLEARDNTFPELAPAEPLKALLPAEPSPPMSCLLYTSDAADEEDSVDLGGRRIL
eukprot:TRINITY_DN17077_c0_g2_i1.p1 TRINITY_DN17077_c0_g2~~TRINITY_DN17077_c0_g2_i1.p1  ORF type:complete len:342 (+),score=98.71 TRINITY_DN17077_c0_g2_i1:68-1027(+)